MLELKRVLFDYQFWIHYNIGRKSLFMLENPQNQPSHIFQTSLFVLIQETRELQVPTACAQISIRPCSGSALAPKILPIGDIVWP